MERLASLPDTQSVGPDVRAAILAGITKLLARAPRAAACPRRPRSCCTARWPATAWTCSSAPWRPSPCCSAPRLAARGSQPVVLTCASTPLLLNPSRLPGCSRGTRQSRARTLGALQRAGSALQAGSPAGDLSDFVHGSREAGWSTLCWGTGSPASHAGKQHAQVARSLPNNPGLSSERFSGYRARSGHLRNLTTHLHVCGCWAEHSAAAQVPAAHTAGGPSLQRQARRRTTWTQHFPGWMAMWLQLWPMGLFPTCQNLSVPPWALSGLRQVRAFCLRGRLGPWRGCHRQGLECCGTHVCCFAVACVG